MYSGLKQVLSAQNKHPGVLGWCMLGCAATGLLKGSVAVVHSSHFVLLYCFCAQAQAAACRLTHCMSICHVALNMLVA